MANETQTRMGNCPTHGAVEGTREVPKVHFPFFIYAIRRLMAGRRPYVCPSCGAPVKPA